MATAVRLDDSYDTTDLRIIVRGAIILGVIQAALVLVVSLVNRGLDGTADAVLTGVVVAIGAAACAFLPGRWTRARSIEGIGGAAGIGLGAAFLFLIIDVVLLQPIGTWTNRWWEIGGMSNWWYHPVWWMVSAYLSWMGAWILANQAARRGTATPLVGVALVAMLAVVLGALAAVLQFPGAGWTVATFSVAILPALALGAVVTGFGAAGK
jgi:hypothetical protein